MSFDALWNAVVQEQKGKAALPDNEFEAAKNVADIITGKHFLEESTGRICKNTAKAGHAEKAAISAVQKEDFFEALSFYNEAIRYCPSENSAELLKFYRGRSEVLVKLNEHEAAEADIRRATSDDNNRQVTLHQIPQQDGQNKATEKNRKERTQKANRSSTENRKSYVGSGLDNIPALHSGRNEQLKCASQCVQLKSNSDRGRHLIASKTIPPGAVLIVETAYACAPSRSYLTSNCSHCCSPLISPVACPLCAAVMFCNETCRDECLSDFHRAECPVLQHLVCGKELTPMSLLVYRTVIKGTKLSAAIAEESDTLVLDKDFQTLHKNSNKQKSAEVYNSDYKAAYLQVTNSDSRNSADRLKRAVTAAYLTECLNTALLAISFEKVNRFELSSDQKQLLTSAFFHHLQSSSCNAYQVTQQSIPNGDIRRSEGQDTGGAIYPTIALVNHSCNPNVARHTHGSTCVVRATRKIAAGEEILDNYGPHFLSDDSANERRRYLRLHYFFECRCQACNGAWPSAVALRTQAAQIICAHCRAVIGNANSPNDLQLMKKCSQCRKKNDFSKLMMSWRDFEGALPSLLSGNSERALLCSLKLLNTLSTCVQQPSHLQARATQVTTLLWSLQGNRIGYP